MKKFFRVWCPDMREHDGVLVVKDFRGSPEWGTWVSSEGSRKSGPLASPCCSVWEIQYGEDLSDTDLRGLVIIV